MTGLTAFTGRSPACANSTQTTAVHQGDDMNALPSSVQSPKVTQIGTRHRFWEVHKAGYNELMWLISTATQRYETTSVVSYQETMTVLIIQDRITSGKLKIYDSEEEKNYFFVWSKGLQGGKKGFVHRCRTILVMTFTETWRHPELCCITFFWTRQRYTWNLPITFQYVCIWKTCGSKIWTPAQKACTNESAIHISRRLLKK